MIRPIYTENKATQYVNCELKTNFKRFWRYFTTSWYSAMGGLKLPVFVSWTLYTTTQSTPLDLTNLGINPWIYVDDNCKKWQVESTTQLTRDWNTELPNVFWSTVDHLSLQETWIFSPWQDDKNDYGTEEGKKQFPTGQASSCAESFSFLWSWHQLVALPTLSATQIRWFSTKTTQVFLLPTLVSNFSNKLSVPSFSLNKYSPIFYNTYVF